MIVFSFVLSLFFSAPVLFLAWIQTRNYSLNKTSNERFAKSARTHSATASELDSASSFSQMHDDEASLLSARGGGRGHRKRGCWLNCREMCCNKQVVSQDRLLQVYLAEATESSHTSVLDD